jgi:hypothetical protein
LKAIIRADLAGRCACILSESADDEVFFTGCQEVRCFRGVWECPLEGQADHDGNYAFQDKDPTPAAKA